MVDLDNIQRPDIPYVPDNALPNGNRYQLVQGANQPPTGMQFDGDGNYLVDVCIALKEAIDGVAAGAIPGSDNPVNVNKFPVTDGNNPPTLSWTQVLTAYIADLAVTTQKIAAQAITNAQLGPGAVQTQNVYPNTITTPLVADGAITIPKMKSSGHRCVIGGNNTDYNYTETRLGAGQVAAGEPGGNSLAAYTIDQLAVNNPISTAGIANGAVATEKLANDVMLNIFKVFYPIGSIYICFTNQTPPFNGQGVTWTTLTEGYAVMTAHENNVGTTSGVNRLDSGQVDGTAIGVNQLPSITYLTLGPPGNQYTNNYNVGSYVNYVNGGGQTHTHYSNVQNYKLLFYRRTA